MKSYTTLTGLALSLALLTLFNTACSRTTPMEPSDDVANHVDYAKSLRHLPGMESTQVQEEVGSPDDIERLESGRVLWHYNRRFCEADARCLYKRVTLTFENQKLVSIRPD